MTASGLCNSKWNSKRYSRRNKTQRWYWRRNSSGKFRIRNFIIYNTVVDGCVEFLGSDSNGQLAAQHVHVNSGDYANIWNIIKGSPIIITTTSTREINFDSSGMWHIKYDDWWYLYISEISFVWAGNIVYAWVFLVCLVV